MADSSVFETTELETTIGIEQDLKTSQNKKYY